MLKFVSIEKASHRAGKFAFVGSDVDKKAGKVIGYDSITGTFNPNTNRVKIDVGIAIKGGLITVHLSQGGDETTSHGTITGGTGKFAGITGTVSTLSPSQNSNMTFVTLRYRL